MGESYIQHVRERLREGDVAVYAERGRTRYLYCREGAWYRLRVNELEYSAEEERIDDRALRAAIKKNYPVETMDASDVHPAVRARVESGTDEAVVATWLMDARLLADRIRDGASSRDEAKGLIAAGHQLEERVGEEGVEKIRERVEEIAEALEK